VSASPAGGGGTFPAAAATVERIIILGAQRYASAAAVAAKGARGGYTTSKQPDTETEGEVGPAPASTREGVPSAATAVRKPDVPMAHDWTVTLAQK